MNVLIAKSFEGGKSVIYADFSGIARTLLIGGSTFHSHTNAPLNPCKGMKSGIKKNSLKAKNLINAHAIFLDEGGQFNKWYLEVLDELLQDLMENSLPFGQKRLIIGSDLGQTLPIVKNKYS